MSFDGHNKPFYVPQWMIITTINLTLVQASYILLNKPQILKMYMTYTERHEILLFSFNVCFHILNTVWKIERERERERKKELLVLYSHVYFFHQSLLVHMFHCHYMMMNNYNSLKTVIYIFKLKTYVLIIVVLLLWKRKSMVFLVGEMLN